MDADGRHPGLVRAVVRCARAENLGARLCFVADSHFAVPRGRTLSDDENLRLSRFEDVFHTAVWGRGFGPTLQHRRLEKSRRVAHGADAGNHAGRVAGMRWNRSPQSVPRKIRPAAPDPEWLQPDSVYPARRRLGASGHDFFAALFL